VTGNDVAAGARQATGWPSKRPPSVWKYHHGRPLIAGTTTVSGPTRAFSRGSIAAIEYVFKQMKTASWTPKSAGSDDARSGWTSDLPPEIKVSPRLRIASR